MYTQKHTVMNGENLSFIAKKFNLPGWHALYYASENAGFRQSNPDPDKIYPGQTITIPASKMQLRQMLQTRLARLRKVKIDAQQFFATQDKELRGTLNDIKRTSDQVDAAATIATLMVNLASTTIKGAQIMKLEGEALSKAAKEFGKDALRDRAKNIRDLAALAVSESKSESSNVLWLVTKSVATSLCDITSPSFWANTFVNLWEGQSWSTAVTRKPQVVFEAAMSKLKVTQASAIHDLDKKIREVEQELEGLNKSPLA